VVLSLVILVTIASNVILWSYQMNQLDWEKMQENIEVTDVRLVNSSAWVTTQNDYIVPIGTRANGSYEYTTAVDMFYESFREDSQVTIRPNSAGQYSEWGSAYPSGTAHWDCCDDEPVDDDSSYVQTTNNNWLGEAYNLEDLEDYGNIAWVRVYIRARIDSAGASSYIRTLIRTYSADYISADIALTASYQDFYTQYDANPFNGMPWTWDEIRFLQAGAFGRNFGSKYTMLTAVWVVVNYGGQRANVRGDFAIDVSTYPFENIRGVGVQLRYRASDSGERWYLNVFNWTSGAYSDSGFNSTVGNLPTTSWEYYAVNLTDQWRSYVRGDGKMIIEFVDAGVDSNQTTIDVDFLAVIVLAEEGVQFSFQNKGASTCHVVSIWVINSTVHERFEADIFVSSGERLNYTHIDLVLPTSSYFVKVVTERGNTAVYSAS
jgi:hypothetical protein